MLRELRIRNYAVIEKLDLQIPEGFAAFTGETGAGKSIIVGALALVLGGRSQPEQLRSGAKEIAVEARFGPPFAPALRPVLEGAGIDGGDELLLRRIVPAAGKSRAFVNDRTVTVGTLEAVGRELVDIHGQHQHQSLLRPETHLDFLDGFAGVMAERERYGESFRLWNELRQEHGKLLALEREKGDRLDLLRFQKGEIDRAALAPGEDGELEAQREKLRHAGRLAEVTEEAEGLIYSGEDPAAAAVSRAAEKLRNLARIDPALEALAALLEESQVQLEEAGREIQNYHRTLDADPALLDQVEDRLAEVNGLKKKHGGTLDAVFDRLAAIEDEIAGLEQSEERLGELDRKIAAAQERVVREARSLSQRRRAAKDSFENRVFQELEQLNLGGSSFEVALARLDAPGAAAVDERGMDRAEFRLTTNAGEPLKALVKVASGGELSRVMLALKTVLAAVDRVPTLVFDEVDIGIGGRTARMVGDRLKGLAKERQVLCVTHLPQIASLADSHYNITKAVQKGKTRVGVKALEGRRRVEEIARMLGGRTVTDTTREHAAELLKARG